MQREAGGEEDILNINQRPKLEDYDDYIFIVLKMLSYNEKTEMVDSEQVSLILGENTVLTFQETKGDVFDPVKCTSAFKEVSVNLPSGGRRKTNLIAPLGQLSAHRAQRMHSEFSILPSFTIS